MIYENGQLKILDQEYNVWITIHPDITRILLSDHEDKARFSLPQKPKSSEPPSIYSDTCKVSFELYTQGRSNSVTIMPEYSKMATEATPQNDHDRFINRMISSRSIKVAPIARECNLPIRKCQRWWRDYTTDNKLYRSY